MKRKLIAALLVAIMLLLAAGCAGGNGQNNGNEHGEGDVNVTDKPAEGNLIKVEPHDADIGIWYSVWYKYDPEYPKDSTKNLWKDWDIRYDPILPDGTYGLYDSGDKEIIMFHLKELTEAGIDFIIMDQTNHIDVGGGFINDRAIAVAQCIQEWNDAGNKPIRYCSAIGAIQWEPAGKTIEDEAVLLNNRYLRKEWGDSYYMVDGKPLLVVYGDGGEQIWKEYKDGGGQSKYCDKFTLRWADNQSRPGYYGWAYDKGTQQDENVMVVMAGWDNRKGHTPVPRNHGEWYRNSWKQVFTAKKAPKIIVINSFNEYAENTGLHTAKTDYYGNDAPDLYWNMTKQYIALFRNGGWFDPDNNLPEQN